MKRAPAWHSSSDCSCAEQILACRSCFAALHARAAAARDLLATCEAAAVILASHESRGAWHKDLQRVLRAEIAKVKEARPDLGDGDATRVFVLEDGPCGGRRTLRD